MQIDLVVILFCIFTWLEAHFMIRIGFHESSLNSLVDLLIEFLNRSDTFLFLTIFRAPDRQRSTPITAAAQVPVLQVLQPFTEAARTSTLRFPVDRVVQLDHAIAASGRTDKPAIQRIIEDWLISSPAMRIIVCMFLDLEYPILRLQHHADLDIQSLILICLGWIIGVLYEFALEWIIVGSVHASLHEFRIQVFQLKELTCHIHHRTHIAIFILQHQRWNTSRFSYPVVISTESRRDVDNTCTILGRYIVSCDYPESALARINPRRQLLIMHIGQLGTFPFANDTERNQFIAGLIVRQGDFSRFGVEIGRKTVFTHNGGHRNARVWIVCLYGYIGDVGAYAKRRIRRQCPRRCGPSQEEWITKLCHLRFRIKDMELCRTSCILDVTITTRLVQLMGTQACSCGWRVWLDCITLVKKAFLVKFFQ